MEEKKKERKENLIAILGIIGFFLFVGFLIAVGIISNKPKEKPWVNEVEGNGTFFGCWKSEDEETFLVLEELDNEYYFEFLEQTIYDTQGTFTYDDIKITTDSDWCIWYKYDVEEDHLTIMYNAASELDWEEETRTSEHREIKRMIRISVDDYLKYLANFVREENPAQIDFGENPEIVFTNPEITKEITEEEFKSKDYLNNVNKDMIEMIPTFKASGEYGSDCIFDYEPVIIGESEDGKIEEAIYHINSGKVLSLTICKNQADLDKAYRNAVNRVLSIEPYYEYDEFTSEYYPTLQKICRIVSYHGEQNVVMGKNYVMYVYNEWEIDGDTGNYGFDVSHDAFTSMSDIWDIINIVDYNTIKGSELENQLNIIYTQ